ncbi:MAG: cytochrome d ubiquinol oxidase subunit II, partial [Deltaproteobacteria bacterium]
MLETIWFLLWGLLWAIYFMLDGFDLGLGTLMPFLGKNEKERQLIHSSVAPFWDGNEVWLITAGGVTFAAFPGAYAVLFSAFYTPLMIILFALIIRAVSIEFRNKREDRPWRSLWDIATAMGSFLPALLFGVAFANIFKGIPIDADGVFHGTILTLLNPYGIAGGLFFLFLFLVHGTLWLAIKSEGELQKRAIETAKRLWVILVIFAVIFLISTAFFTTLYSNYVN